MIEGSRRPKNKRIRRIRIRNTDRNHRKLPASQNYPTCLRENLYNIWTAYGSKEPGADGQYVIPRQGGPPRIPARIHARLAASGFRVVQHIVVQQRGGMDYLANKTNNYII